MGLWKVFDPFFRGVRNLVEDWNGEPERPGVAARPGVMETLKAHGDKIRDIQKQVTPNHGSTLKLSEELQELRREVVAVANQVSGIAVKGQEDREAVSLVAEQVDELVLKSREDRMVMNDHLENVPLLVEEILGKAQESAQDLFRSTRYGAYQSPLFEDNIGD